MGIKSPLTSCFVGLRVFVYYQKVYGCQQSVHSTLKMLKQFYNVKYAQ